MPAKRTMECDKMSHNRDDNQRRGNQYSAINTQLTSLLRHLTVRSASIAPLRFRRKDRGGSCVCPGGPLLEQKVSRPFTERDQDKGQLEPEWASADQANLRSLARIEWEYIHYALAVFHGNISRTAQALGLHRRSLQRKLGRIPPRS